MQFLHTVLYTFLQVFTRRVYPRVKTLASWVCNNFLSFKPWCLIQGWYHFLEKLDDYLYLGVKGLSKFHHSNRKIFPMKTYKNKRKVEVIKSNYQTKLNCLIFVLLFFCRKFSNKTKLDALCVLEPFTKPSFPCHIQIYPKRAYENNYNQPFLYAREKMDIC